VTSAAIERGEGPAGRWIPLPLEVTEVSGAFFALDRTAVAGRGYYYRLIASLSAGGTTTFGPVAARSGDSIVESALTLVAPNPSAGATQIQFAVARAGHVRLLVADVAGRVLATLLDGNPKPGRYSVSWDGKVGQRPVPSGVFFLRLMTPDRTVVRSLSI